ncbi:MAG: GNAT family N-acetyltransferase [Candidatus Marinimicrobia bacterium]|nr:GNAT family N-acetyltransferase [Candidatus Neomarinimicrobiota bacterium]MBT4033558.1 GNAT family N-acetyltransferase [Candidatus Neomarinimicrobiota bacterium]MBT4361600.1 GNAT family N-acetyltransferase [Candidatus Neomarinimicrobiota bacterium]MBT4713637.1 GNAT family N-acetyltransferase [Candidatus Neomarinimicrobiota bacterium]MBT4944549.1 GNAT family N-acetyltransferase [Candidatus Neomarinimicrobiota bacterium]
MSSLKIIEARHEDFELIWPIFHEIVSSGDTYAYPSDMSKIEAFNVWITQPQKTYIAMLNDEVLGTYYIKTNPESSAHHICNCGYMVASKARGQGLATSMCTHSQLKALELGYLAMQFNFVIASNLGAIRLWTKLGFETVERLPRVFNHPTLGLIDALVMYKLL